MQKIINTEQVVDVVVYTSGLLVIRDGEGEKISLNFNDVCVQIDMECVPVHELKECWELNSKK